MRKLALIVVLSTAMVSPAQVPSTYWVPSNRDIRATLKDRIDTQHKSVGMVVGIVTRHGRQVVGYGHFDATDPRVPDGKTVFEIGSISKVFTSLLLADMVLRGEVALSDPVSKYLPPSVHVPERDGKQITLLDLSQHYSGLPRMPTNFHPRNPSNPFADYTLDQMYEFLNTYKLPRAPGAKYEYSNFGGALLAQALAQRAGTDYETLLRTRITEPLGLKSTAVKFTPAMEANLAPGHNQMLNRTATWDMAVFAGAGGIRSTVDDMLTFLAANLGFTKTPLAPAMAEMLKVPRRTASPGVDVALGWHVYTTGDEIVWHNGQTGGYHTFAGFDVERKVGVVVLSNSDNDIDDMGLHLLRGGSSGPTRRQIGPRNPPWNIPQ